MDWRLNMIPFKGAVGSIVFLAFVLIGCKTSASVSFQTRVIKIKDKSVTVEIAETPEQRQQGLMNRKSLPKDTGMLFIFNRSQNLSFWMKNTLIPLSIGFFDKDKKLLNIKKMHPPKSMMVKDSELPRYSSSGPAKYALEMNINWFKTNKVKPGDVFKFQPE